MMEESEPDVGKSASASASQPSTDSDLKEERIAARRKRVRAKIEAEKRAALGEEPEEVGVANVVIGWLLLTCVEVIVFAFLGKRGIC